MLCTLYSGEKFPLKKEKKKNISRLFLSGKQRIPPSPSTRTKCFSRFLFVFSRLANWKKYLARRKTMERTMEIEQEKKKTYRFPQRILSSRPIIINPFLVWEW